jgi:DNA-binding MarR family transcriptional regulator
VAKSDQTADEVRDRVDARIGRWVDEIPGLDLPTEAITQRVHLINRGLDKALSEVTEGFGLSVGEYMVLTMLRGQGEPYRMSPSRLADWCVLSTGAMTNRLDNLEQAALVKRVPDPEDRRSVQVTLTKKGHKLWDEMAGTAAAREALIASALDEDEKEQLNALLRRLVLALEREVGPLKKTPPSP